MDLSLELLQILKRQYKNAVNKFMPTEIKWKDILKTTI